MRGTIGSIALGVVLCWWGLGCGPKPVPRTPVKGVCEGWDVILVTVDTLRADHIGCYGYPGILTPNLDRLAAEGARFAFCIANQPLTGPSHASILSGQRSATHGVVANNQKVPESVRMLAQEAQERGYDPAGFVSAWVLFSRFGFDRGFARFDDGEADNLDEGSEWFIQPEKKERLFRRSDVTNVRVLEWLEAHEGGKPDFVWIHYWDVHEPWDVPEEYLLLYGAAL